MLPNEHIHLIRQIIKELTENYRTNDPFVLADKLNFTIIPFPFNVTKGLYFILFGYKIIGYNSRLPSKYHSFIVAHELGHYFIDTDSRLKHLRRLKKLKIMLICLLWN